MKKPVITRFAPSPTGYLHVGGARTALFNWLYARRHGGKMILRIEDTDLYRSTDKAIDGILEGLAWLGLNADEGPIYQSARADRHREIAKRLVKDGKAYHFDDSAAVRFKIPQSGHTAVHDMVQGRISLSNDKLDDTVLIRSDGSPTYMLAVVVDDHDMEVTHVIRGDDHCTSAVKQALIYDALGWERPEFAHIPLIHGADGEKMSKRHNTPGMDFWRDGGYLPEAMLNHLAKLGWRDGDEEIFSVEWMIEKFDLKKINRSPARFDFDALNWLNREYMRTMSDDDFQKTLIERMKGPVDDNMRASIRVLLPALKDKAHTLNEAADMTGFLRKDNRGFLGDPDSALEGAAKMLQAVPETDWNVKSVDSALRAFAKDTDLKFGEVARPLRTALTQDTNAPDIFHMIAALGKTETMQRISGC